MCITGYKYMLIHKFEHDGSIFDAPYLCCEMHDFYQTAFMNSPSLNN